MLHVVTMDSKDVDCVAVRRGLDVVLCVSRRLLSPQGAVAMNAAVDVAVGDVDQDERAG